jgi:hypothetical protein
MVATLLICLIGALLLSVPVAVAMASSCALVFILKGIIIISFTVLDSLRQVLLF